MQSGYFFFTDVISHKIDKKFTFRYNQVKSKLNHGSLIQDYPIYVTIEETNIRFLFNGKMAKGEEATNVHFEIFSLPLYNQQGSQGKLEDQVKHLFNEENEKVILSENVYERKTDKMNDSFISYSNLGAKIHFKRHTLNHDRESFVINHHVLSKKQIFLDFLFELQHSVFFKRFPFYNAIETKLKSIPLIYAIMSQFNYYYIRQKYLEAREDSKSESEYAFETDEWALRLEKAEREWLSIVSMPASVELFFNSNGWFSSTEREMRAIVFNIDQNFEANFSNIRNWFPKKKEKDTPLFERSKWRKNKKVIHRGMKNYNSQFTRVVNTFFLDRYNMFRIINFSFNTVRRKFNVILALILFAIAVYFFVRGVVPFSTSEYFRILMVALITSGIFLSVVIPVLNRRNQNFDFNSIMPRMLIAIISSWIVFATTSEFWGIGFYLEYKWIICLVIIIFLGTVYYIKANIQKRFVDIALMHKASFVSRAVIVSSYGLLFSLAVGSLIMLFMGSNMMRIAQINVYLYKDHLAKQEESLEYLCSVQDTLNQIPSCVYMCQIIELKDIPPDQKRMEFTSALSNVLSYIDYNSIPFVFGTYDALKSEYDYLTSAGKDENLMEVASFFDTSLLHIEHEVNKKINATEESRKLIAESTPLTYWRKSEFQEEDFQLKLILLMSPLAFFIGIFIQLVLVDQKLTDPI